MGRGCVPLLLVALVGCSNSGLSLPPTDALVPDDDRGDALRAAAAATRVPLELLAAIAQVETRQEHLTGTVELDGWPAAHGIMGLRGSLLDDAAALLGDHDRAATELRGNVMAAALLLDAWADEEGIDRAELGAWAPLVARYSGVHDPIAASGYVHDEVYALLRAADPDLVGTVDYPAPPSLRDATDVTFSASPHHSSRGDAPISMVVVHTCEGSYSGCWGWLVNPASKVSAHYVVDGEGAAVRQLVEEDRKAWHIGATYRCDLNDDTLCEHDGGSSNALSIGVEHAGYASQSSWSEGLVERSAELVCSITERHGIPADANHIVGHGQLQPYNRTDPGAAWPWADYLARIQDCRAPTHALGLREEGLAADGGDALSFVVEVPEGATRLEVVTSGGTGDADLYVRHGEVPTKDAFDCRPYVGGNEERCVWTEPAAGPWHVQLAAYSAFAGVSLEASVDLTPAPAPLLAESGLAGAASDAFDLAFELPEGHERLTVTLAGGTGDADLYVAQGSAPTLSAFDCRPYVGGNDEVCTFDAPSAGTWHVMVRGYTAFADVALVALAD